MSRFLNSLLGSIRSRLGPSAHNPAGHGGIGTQGMNALRFKSFGITAISTLHPGAIGESIVVSPDQRRVAFAVVEPSGRWFVVVDGEEGERFDGILPQTLQFSPDSRHVAYAASRGEGSFAVVDGVQGKEYRQIAKASLLFSPDSARRLYRLARRESDPRPRRGRVRRVRRSGIGKPLLQSRWESYRLCGGAEWQDVRRCRWQGSCAYDGIGASSPVFSPGSHHVAYAAGRDGKVVLVLDGGERRQHDSIGPGTGIVFSPDSQRLAYAARCGDDWLLVLDDKEQPRHEGIGNVSFSPDSRRIGYVAFRGGKNAAHVVVDGARGRVYDAIGEGPPRFPLFSPDSRRVLYVAVPGDASLLSSMARKARTTMASPSVAPISARTAGTSRIEPSLSGKRFVVLDGDEGTEYDNSGNPVFSPDSQHVAYRAMGGDRWFVVVDGFEGRGLEPGDPLHRATEYDGFLRGSKLTFRAPTEPPRLGAPRQSHLSRRSRPDHGGSPRFIARGC